MFGNPRPRAFYFSRYTDLVDHRILALNVHISSSKKLAIQYPDEPPVKFTDEMEEHMLMFETYSRKDDWMLTDVDGALNGNPYFSESAN